MTRALRAVSTPPQGDAGDLANMPDTFLQCRELGHSWRPGHDTITRSTRGKVVEFSRQLFCQTCGCEAWDKYETRDFTRVGTRKISYPEGYLTKGHGRVPRSEARRALFGGTLKGKR